MTKQIKNRINKKRHSKRRNYLLAKDGTNFTLEMAVPSSQIQRPFSHIFEIVQSFVIEGWHTTSTTVPTFTTVTFNLGQVDQVSALQTIFDEYRIPEVEAWIIPQVSASVSNARTGLYSTAIDFDDATNLTTTAQALDYESCVTIPQTSGVYRRFQPHAANALYAPSAFTSFGNVPSPWIDSASSAVSHYGLKLAADANVGGSSQVFNLRLRLRIQFKNVR